MNRKKEIETAKCLENAVNDFSWNGDAFVEQVCYGTHRTLQATIFRTMLKVIKEMGSDRYRYDLRNEACHRVSKMICEAGLAGEHIPYI